MKAATLYFDRGLSREAAELYERTVELDPNHLEALRGLVEIAHINGEKAKMAHWGCELGDVLLAREMYSEAKYQFERVLAFDPANNKAQARVKRLNTMAGVQDTTYGELTPTASEVEGAQVTVREDDPSGGNVQSAFDLSEILDEFKSAVVESIPAEDAGSHYDLGVTYMEMGLHEEAAAEFEVAGRDPDLRSRSIEMLAECYRHLDRPQDAVQVLTEILPQLDAETRARAHVQVGRAQEAMGEWDSAGGSYEQALSLNAGLDEARELLADLDHRREQGAA